MVSLGGDNTTRAGEGAEDVRVEPRRMAVRIGPGTSPRPTTHTDLGTITISGTQWGPGIVSAEITVSCNIWEGMTLRRCRIDLDPHPGAMSRESRRNWNKPQRQRSELLGREGYVQLQCWNSEFNPFWRVDGMGAPVGLFEYPDFAALEGLSPGGRVTVTLTARLRDLSYDDEDNQRATERRDDLLEVDDDGRPRTTTPQEISKSRRRVLALIHQDGLNIGTNGNVEIASHVLVIVKEGE